MSYCCGSKPSQAFQKVQGIQTPGRIQTLDAPGGSVIYPIGVLESKIGESIYVIFYDTILYTIFYYSIPYSKIVYNTIKSYIIL